MPVTLVILIALALIFDFTNGLRGSSNIVATMITSRAMPPRVALAITALAEFSGPFIFGVALAKTIGAEIVSPDAISMAVIIAALVSAVLWNLLTWYLGLPSGASHALIGGIVGSVAASVGLQQIHLAGLEKVLISLFASPMIGFAMGYLITILVTMLCLNATPRVNTVFKRGQILTAVALALSHGTNDSQMAMGIITMGLVTSGYLDGFAVPFWVVFACAAVIAIGSYLGAWRLIRTLGSKFYKIRPMDSFNIQLSSAIVVLGASLIGGPVSTTQVVSTSIMGVGAAERINKVRWGVAGEILIAWVLTIPATALVGAAAYWAISRIIG